MTTTNMHTTVEHATILTRVVLRTMARGTQKQAAQGSLSSDSHAPDMIRELRAGLARDARTMTRYAAMDNGTTIYNDDNSYRGILIDGDTVPNMPETLSDSMDIVNEAVLAICEAMPHVNHNTPYELTEDALKHVYSAINHYIYGQKSKHSTRAAYIEDMSGIGEDTAPSDYIRVLSYFDIATTQDYDGYMDAYKRLVTACTSVQRQVLRYLAQGRAYKYIALKIYGNTDTAHVQRVQRHVKQIRSIACCVFADSWQVKHYQAYQAN